MEGDENGYGMALTAQLCMPHKQRVEKMQFLENHLTKNVIRNTYIWLQQNRKKTKKQKTKKKKNKRDQK